MTTVGKMRSLGEECYFNGSAMQETAIAREKSSVLLLSATILNTIRRYFAGRGDYIYIH